jgi:hypothetical protein
LTADSPSFSVSHTAQQPSAAGYPSSKLERRRGSHVGRTLPELQYPTEHPVTTGTSFSQHYQAHSHQRPEAMDSQRRPSISNTRTSSEGRDGPFSGQPIPREIHHPLASEDQRGGRHHERALSNSGQPENRPPPPGLREPGPQDINAGSPEIRGCCLRFK